MSNENLVIMKEISKLPEYQIVSVRVKVEDATEVKTVLIKQDYWIADATGCCKVVTWEDNVGILSVGESYKLSGVVV